MLPSASAIPATMKIHPIAFFGRLLTITMPRTGTPRLTNTSRTSEALQTATLLGTSLPRSTNISTRAASSSAIETIPTDQASLRAVHVVMRSPRPRSWDYPSCSDAGAISRRAIRSGSRGAEPFGGTYSVERPVTPESARWRTSHGSMNGRPTGNGVAS